MKSSGIDPNTIYIGSKVKVGDNMGIVRYIGPVAGALTANNYYGIEFDIPVGKNAGQGPNGDEYFSARKNCGLFVLKDKVTLVK